MRAFVFLIFLLTTISSSAQLTLGVKGGINYSKFNGDEFYRDENASKTGVTFGLIIEPKLAKHFSLKLEVNYDQKGTNVAESQWMAYVGYTNVSANFIYLSLPVMLKVNFGQKGIFYFNTGMSYSFLLKANFQAKQGDKFIVNSDIKSSYNSSDLSYVVGLGVKIPLTPKLGIIIDPRYVLGLSNIAKQDPYFKAQTLKNSTLSVAIGLVVQLGKNKETKDKNNDE